MSMSARIAHFAPLSAGASDRLLHWTKPSRTWTRSTYFEQPAIGQEQETVLRQWTLVAGGLALIPQSPVAHDGAARNQPARVPTDCLVVMHEIAELADPVPRGRCWRGFRLRAHRSSAHKPGATKAHDAAMAAPGASVLPSSDSIVPSSQSQAKEEMLSQLALEDA